METAVYSKHDTTQQADHIFNLCHAFINTYGLLAAQELNLFQIIEKNKIMDLAAISNALNLAPRAAQALTSLCASLNLLHYEVGKGFSLTQLSKNYLLPKSPSYMGDFVNMLIKMPFSYEKFKQALQTDQANFFGTSDLFELSRVNPEIAELFTLAMHNKSMAAATFWPKALDLSAYKCLLDIAGGSGANAIVALQQWPNLQAIVMEMPSVCEVAKKFIEKVPEKTRIQVQAGDMWTDNFPTADIHFYSDIFHDWPLEKSKALIAKSYKSLPAGGRIIIHELLFNNDKTGPHSVAAHNVAMLIATHGQQYSRQEMFDILQSVGFADVEIIPTKFGDWSLLSGVKKKG